MLLEYFGINTNCSEQYIMKQNATSIIRKSPIDLLNYIEKCIGTDCLFIEIQRIQKQNTELFNEKESMWKALLLNINNLQRCKCILSQELTHLMNQHKWLHTWNKCTVDGLIVMHVLIRYNEWTIQAYHNQQACMQSQLKAIEDQIVNMQLEIDLYTRLQLHHKDIKEFVYI